MRQRILPGSKIVVAAVALSADEVVGSSSPESNKD